MAKAKATPKSTRRSGQERRRAILEKQAARAATLRGLFTFVEGNRLPPLPLGIAYASGALTVEADLTPLPFSGHLWNHIRRYVDQRKSKLAVRNFRVEPKTSGPEFAALLTGFFGQRVLSALRPPSSKYLVYEFGLILPGDVVPQEFLSTNGVAILDAISTPLDRCVVSVLENSGNTSFRSATTLRVPPVGEFRTQWHLRCELLSSAEWSKLARMREEEPARSEGVLKSPDLSESSLPQGRDRFRAEQARQKRESAVLLTDFSHAYGTIVKEALEVRDAAIKRLNSCFKGKPLLIPPAAARAFEDEIHQLVDTLAIETVCPECSKAGTLFLQAAGSRQFCSIQFQHGSGGDGTLSRCSGKVLKAPGPDQGLTFRRPPSK